MNSVLGPRASSILYNVIKSNKGRLEEGYVVLPSNVCPIVPVIFLKAEVAFKFIDIDPLSQCLDLSLLEKEVSKEADCKGVLFVHSYGSRQNTENIFKTLRNLNAELFLIDDRCVGVPEMGVESQNPEANLNLYSTGYAKFVEFGRGGFGYLSEDTNYEIHSSIFNEADHRLLVGQMNESIQKDKAFIYKDSAWLEQKHDLVEAEYFDRINVQLPISRKHKDLLNSIYSDQLPKELQMPMDLCQWRFNLQIDNKEQLLKAIFDGGLFASSHYTSVSRVFGGNEAPVAEATHSRMLNLFNDFRFTERDAMKVCKIINKTLNL